VFNGIARLLETERDPERLAMLEPFAVQASLIRVVDRGWVLDFCQRPDQEEYLLDAESRFVEAETDAVFRLDAAGADYPRNDATASFIYQTLGKRKEAHIR
jgi:hypothetical protein